MPLLTATRPWKAQSGCACRAATRAASACAASADTVSTTAGAGVFCVPTVVHALTAVAANVSFVEIESDQGHDAFLLDEPDFHATLAGFLTGCAELRGLKGKP